ncbi:FlgD immunoglobulin-like domain containing protein [Candidatus Latescibacterota bacterium]
MKNSTPLSLVICCIVVCLASNAYSQGVYGTHIDVDIPEYYLDPEWSGHSFPKYAVMYQAIFHTKLYPVWSPAGGWIYFTDGKYGIWKVKTTGGKPELVYDNYDMYYWSGKAYTLGGLEPIGISSDGSELTFVRWTINEEEGTEIREDSAGNITEVRYPYPVIEVVNLETGEKRLLAESAFGGSWSSDGRYFAYLFRHDIYRYDGDIAVIDTETGNDWRLDVDANSLCITPDNKFVIFSQGDTQDDSPLYRVPLDGGGADQVTILDNQYDFDLDNFSPHVSPDGEWIIYYGNYEFKEIELFVSNTITDEVIEIFPDENTPVYDPNKQPRSFIYPKFSPDGTTICYVMKAEDFQYGVLANELYLVDFTLGTRQPSMVHWEEPSQLAILGSYPNPFNLQTTIDFTIPVNGYVELVLYNTIGHKIRDIFAGSLNTGSHSYDWNGRDDHGNPVPSGVYFYQLRMGRTTANGRMLLMK